MELSDFCQVNGPSEPLEPSEPNRQDPQAGHVEYGIFHPGKLLYSPHPASLPRIMIILTSITM